MADLVIEMGGAGGQAAVESTIEEKPEFSLPEEFSADVALLGVDLVPLDNISDFSFVERVRVDLASGDSDSQLPPIRLIDYQRPEDNIGPISVEGNSLDNLLEYLQSDVIQIGVEFRGDLPDEQWSVVVDTCFSVSGEYRKELL